MKCFKTYLSLGLGPFLVMMEVKTETDNTNDLRCFPSSLLPCGQENSWTAYKTVDFQIHNIVNSGLPAYCWSLHMTTVFFSSWWMCGQRIQVSSNTLKRPEEVTWKVNPSGSSATANTGAIENANQIHLHGKKVRSKILSSKDHQ